MENCNKKRNYSNMVEDVDNCCDNVEKKLSSVFSSNSSQNSIGTSSTTSNTTQISFLKIQRKVRFNSKVKVVLIPCLADYKDENIQDLLWWNTEDYELSYKTMISNDYTS